MREYLNKGVSNVSDFLVAKNIALGQPRGTYRRAYNGKLTNYSGYKNEKGECFVFADSTDDIQNPDCFLNQRPAIKVN